jgi:dTDP-4-amino-4,6-dideoxygalactose transaminase
LDSEQQTLNVVSSLNSKDIYPRRYFHPSLDTVQYISSDQVMGVSRDISSRILCLPIYPDLAYDEQAMIIDMIIEAVG